MRNSDRKVQLARTNCATISTHEQEQRDADVKSEPESNAGFKK
jgi:hypothetical protein